MRGQGNRGEKPFGLFKLWIQHCWWQVNFKSIVYAYVLTDDWKDGGPWCCKDNKARAFGTGLLTPILAVHPAMDSDLCLAGRLCRVGRRGGGLSLRVLLGCRRRRLRHALDAFSKASQSFAQALA